MFKSKSKHDTDLSVDALIGSQVEIRGDVVFSGSLYVEGRIIGKVIAEEVGENLYLASRNLPNVLVVEPRYVDPLSLVFYRKVLVTKGALGKLQEMFA